MDRTLINLTFCVFQTTTKLQDIKTHSRYTEAPKECLTHDTVRHMITLPYIFNSSFLHGNSLREAVWSRKIHVQIMRFSCCLNMALTWKSLNWALICMHDVTPESGAAVTDHIADAFVRENIAHVYMTFESLTLTPFCLEKSSVRKKDI